MVEALEKQNNDLQTKIEEETDVITKQKLLALKKTSDELLESYQQYKEGVETYSVKADYSAAIAAVNAFFVANNYELSSELLLHAKSNKTVNSSYSPTNGYKCYSSPVTVGIWKGAQMSGSATYPRNAFQGSVINDLFFAIHQFTYSKTISLQSTYLNISDRYDFTNSDYKGITDIAVSAMVAAQNAGQLTPYYVKIKLN